MGKFMNTIKSGPLNGFRLELNTKYNDRYLDYDVYFGCGLFIADFYSHVAPISGSFEAKSGDTALSRTPPKEGVSHKHQPGSRRILYPQAQHLCALSQAQQVTLTCTHNEPSITSGR